MKMFAMASANTALPRVQCIRFQPRRSIEVFGGRSGTTARSTWQYRSKQFVALVQVHLRRTIDRHKVVNTQPAVLNLVSPLNLYQLGAQMKCQVLMLEGKSAHAV